MVRADVCVRVWLFILPSPSPSFINPRIDHFFKLLYSLKKTKIRNWFYNFTTVNDLLQDIGNLRTNTEQLCSSKQIIEERRILL